MIPLKNAIKNRKNKIVLSISIGSGDDNKDNKELGLAPEVQDEGANDDIHHEQSESGHEQMMEAHQGDAAEMQKGHSDEEIVKSILGDNASESDSNPRSLAGKAKMKMLSKLKGKKGY